MKATIDANGCITLGPEVQARLGVRPGDEVILEDRGDEWVLKAVPPKTGLSREGNVLIHRGVSASASSSDLEDNRDDRFEQLRTGLPR
jgi:bifunctional DNA-binding transcriptional regulator/antitoxin component of YhaV-PrlF toxin-antitoxin module